MSRIELISTRRQASTPEQQAVFDAVVESRGRMIRPFEVLIHAPQVAAPLSEVGAALRFRGTLSAHDRELAILATASFHGCGYEWQSHESIALGAGVRPEALHHLATGDGDLSPHEELIVAYVRGLCADTNVPADLFEQAHDRLGRTGVVELTATVGYYTLLAMVMGATDTC